MRQIPLDPATLAVYIQLGLTAVRLGTEAYQSLRAIWAAHGLTPEEIHTIAAGIIAEDEALKPILAAMAKRDAD